MTRKEAIAALNRMGQDYDTSDIEEVMSGDQWVPTTDEEWRRWNTVTPIMYPQPSTRDGGP